MEATLRRRLLLKALSRLQRTLCFLTLRRQRPMPRPRQQMVLKWRTGLRSPKRRIRLEMWVAHARAALPRAELGPGPLKAAAETEGPRPRSRVEAAAAEAAAEMQWKGELARASIFSLICCEIPSQLRDCCNLEWIFTEPVEYISLHEVF